MKTRKITKKIGNEIKSITRKTRDEFWLLARFRLQEASHWTAKKTMNIYYNTENYWTNSHKQTE